MALAALVTDAVDAIYVLSPEGRFLYANPAACALTGYTADELEDAPFDDLVSELDRERVGWMFRSAVERQAPLTYELELRRKDGKAVALEVRSTRLVWDGRVVGVQCIARDVSARRTRTRELEHQALHDPLTDLPNRALFRDRLEQAVLAERRKGVPFAVLVMDLDGFKEVNDELGHAAGDAVLAEVAGRLRGTLRASDTVARLGGDEFAILVEDCGSSGAKTVAGKLLRALESPVRTSGLAVRVGASIGIGLCPDHADDPDGLLERADAAMYAAKRGGRGAAIGGVGDVDFGRRARRRPPAGSGRLSGFLAGAAAALLLVAGVATPPLQRAPHPPAPGGSSGPSGNQVTEGGAAERALEGWLSGASSGDPERIGSTGEPELEMAPVAFRIGMGGVDAVDGVDEMGDRDDDRDRRPTGPLARTPNGMRILQRGPSEGEPKVGDPPTTGGEGPAPDRAPGGGNGGPGGETGPPQAAKPGAGDDRSGRGGSKGEPTRPRTPRRPGRSGGKAEHAGGGNRATVRVDQRSGNGGGGSMTGGNAKQAQSSNGNGGKGNGGKGNGGKGNGGNGNGGNGNGGNGNGGNGRGRS